MMIDECYHRMYNVLIIIDYSMYCFNISLMSIIEVNE